MWWECCGQGCLLIHSRLRGPTYSASQVNVHSRVWGPLSMRLIFFRAFVSPCFPTPNHDLSTPFRSFPLWSPSLPRHTIFSFLFISSHHFSLSFSFHHVMIIFKRFRCRITNSRNVSLSPSFRCAMGRTIFLERTSTSVIYTIVCLFFLLSPLLVRFSIDILRVISGLVIIHGHLGNFL